MTDDELRRASELALHLLRHQACRDYRGNGCGIVGLWQLASAEEIDTLARGSRFDVIALKCGHCGLLRPMGAQFLERRSIQQDDKALLEKEAVPSDSEV